MYMYVYVYIYIYITNIIAITPLMARPLRARRQEGLGTIRFCLSFYFVHLLFLCLIEYYCLFSQVYYVLFVPVSRF